MVIFEIIGITKLFPLFGQLQELPTLSLLPPDSSVRSRVVLTFVVENGQFDFDELVIMIVF